MGLWPSRGFLEACRGLQEASWELLWPTWELLGASCGSPGGSWGLLGERLGALEAERIIKPTYFRLFCRVSFFRGATCSIPSGRLKPYCIDIGRASYVASPPNSKRSLYAFFPSFYLLSYSGHPLFIRAFLPSSLSLFHSPFLLRSSLFLIHYCLRRFIHYSFSCVFHNAFIIISFFAL